MAAGEDPRELNPEEDLYPKKELLDDLGITSRTLNYWHSEGVLPSPVLYKGQGGNSYYTERQRDEAATVLWLNKNFGQSISDIRTIKQRIKEDLAEDPDLEWPYDDDLYLYLLEEVHFPERVKVDMAGAIGQFKRGERILIQFAGSYFLVDATHHGRSYQERGGKIFRALGEQDFENGRWYEFGEIGEIFQFGDQLEQLLKGEPIVDTPSEELKRKVEQTVQLINQGIMYLPPYLYKDRFYFHPDDLLVAKYFLSLWNDMGLEACKSVKRRIEEDIDAFFCFPQASAFHYPSFLRFNKEIITFRECLMALWDFYPKSNEEFGFSCPEHTRIGFIRRYIDGLIQIRKSSINGEFIFELKPISSMSPQELAEAAACNRLPIKALKQHLQDRIRSTEEDLDHLRELYGLLSEKNEEADKGGPACCGHSGASEKTT